MKKMVIFFMCIIGCFTAQAQVPQAFSYKVLIKDNGGNPHSNKRVNLKISIIQDNLNGNPVYIEKQSILTSQSGVLDIEIGRGVPLLGQFADIDWSQPPYFIKSEVDLKCAGKYNLIAVTELLSVPYAMYADKAANGFSGNYKDLINKPDIPTKVSELQNNAGYLISENDPFFANSVAAGITKNDTLRWNRNEGFDGNMHNLNITNLKKPINSKDAANKQYVDDLIDLLYTNGNIQLKDFDGNTYDVVKIGNQLWMKDYLSSSHFNNGDPIPVESPMSKDNWIVKTGIYGTSDRLAFYRKEVVLDNRNVCPKGWHVPDATDWDSLFVFLGAEYDYNSKFFDWSDRNYWFRNSQFVSDKITYNGSNDESRNKPWCTKSTDDFGLSIKPLGFIDDRNNLGTGQALFLVMDNRIKYGPGGQPAPKERRIFTLIFNNCKEIIKEQIDLYYDNYIPIKCIRD